MWVSKAKWEWLKGELEKRDLMYDHMMRNWGSRVAALQEEATRFHQRTVELEDTRAQTTKTFIDAVATARACTRESVLLRAQINELRVERAALLAKLVDGLSLQVPQIGGPRRTVDPAIDFEGPDPDDPYAADPSDQLDGLALIDPDDPATIASVIGMSDDEPGLSPGTVVGGRRPPTDA
jgi:hypothetical protein